MAARTRRVVWAESAQRALDEVIAYISQDSPDGAVRVLSRVLAVDGKVAGGDLPKPQIDRGARLKPRVSHAQRFSLATVRKHVTNIPGESDHDRTE